MNSTASYEDRNAAKLAFATTTVKNIARALSAASGAAWTRVGKNDDNGYLWTSLCNGAEQIHLGLDEYKNRVSVSANWPKLPDGSSWLPRQRHGEAPSITVDATKPVEQIARDIVRRFLPEYRRLLALALEDVASSTKYRDDTKAAFDEVVAASKGYLQPSTNGREPGSANIHGAPGIGYGSIRVSANSVTFDHFSTSVEFAKRLFALIEQYGKDFPAKSDE